jgi:predicted N-acetyltransferase YhbS
MEFRHYNLTEASSIKELFTSVFSESEGEPEGQLIGDLAKELLISTAPEDLFVFVAVEDNEVVGAIFVTRMPAEKESEIFVLAPVAVATKQQGKGIGQKLIQYGIKELKEVGVKVLVTYGDPNFYSKTGFQKIAEKTIQPPFKLTQPEGWLAQALDGSPLQMIEGKCSCVSALDDSRYW